jgi:hypothetical protein
MFSVKHVILSASLKRSSDSPRIFVWFLQGAVDDEVAPICVLQHDGSFLRIHESSLSKEKHMAAPTEGHESYRLNE